MTAGLDSPPEQAGVPLSQAEIWRSLDRSKIPLIGLLLSLAGWSMQRPRVSYLQLSVKQAVSFQWGSTVIWQKESNTKHISPTVNRNCTTL